MERRSFLNNGIWAIGTAVLSASLPEWTGAEANVSRPSSDSKTMAYAAESGIYGRDSYYVIGLLDSSDADTVANQLSTIRNKTGYRSKLSYTSNDRYKLAYVQHCVDLFVDSPLLSFSIFIIEKNKEKRDERMKNAPSKLARLLRRAGYYDQLLEKAACKAPAIQTKSQAIFGPSKSFGQHFKKATGKQLKAVDTVGNDLLQLSDFLTGCVYSEASESTRNPIKTETVEYLKEKLGLASLLTNKEKKFMVHTL